MAFTPLALRGRWVRSTTSPTPPAAGTNKLTAVSDAAPTAGKNFGFKSGSGAGYTYDANGNLKTDSYKGITAITYNYLNLPSKISFGSSKSITITYDATGRKLKKVTGGGAGAENYTQYYADGLEYMGTTLEAIYHEEGRVTPKTGSTWQYEYSIRDHLGNTRLTFADKDGDKKISLTNVASTNEVLQENHYTPFGLELGYAWVNDAGVDTRYRFGGKEFNEDFGLRLNDHGARMYDPAIGRWTSPDPLSPVLKSRSSYEYSLSNPLRFSDPTGMYPYPSAEDYDLGRARLVSGSLSFDNGKASGGVYRSKLNNPDIGSELLKTFSTFIQQSSDEIEQMPEVEGSSGEDMVDYYRQLNAPEDDAQQIRINDLVDPTDAIESGVFQRGAVSFTNNLSHSDYNNWGKSSDHSL